jgi:hypothetical protein
MDDLNVLGHIASVAVIVAVALAWVFITLDS